MQRKAVEIEAGRGDQRRHAGLALAARHFDAIDIGFLDAREQRRALRPLRRWRHSRPSSGRCRRCGRRNRNSHAGRAASDRRCGTRHRPSRRHRAGSSSRCLRPCWCSRRSGSADRWDRFCRIASPTSPFAVSRAEAIRPAQRHALFDIEAHQPDLLDVARIPGHAADGADLAVIIDHADIAFGRAVEFHDARNAESAPGIAARSRDASRCRWRCADVIALVRMRRRVQQIAAKLADILEHGRLIAVAIVPEFGGGEPLRTTSEPPPRNGGPSAAMPPEE